MSTVPFSIACSASRRLRSSQRFLPVNLKPIDEKKSGRLPCGVDRIIRYVLHRCGPCWTPNPIVTWATVLFSSHLPIGSQPYPVIYVDANLVRGLLDRKRSEEHLQALTRATTTKTQRKAKQKRQKERNNNKIHIKLSN